MISDNDVAQVIEDFGSWCFIRILDQTEPQRVFMVVHEVARGSFGNRSVLSQMLDNRETRRGATWGYGLIMAEDAPEGMSEKAKVAVTDSLGRGWNMDVARKVLERNDETGNLELVAWRLALWSEQRAMMK